MVEEPVPIAVLEFPVVDETAVDKVLDADPVAVADDPAPVAPVPVDEAVSDPDVAVAEVALPVAEIIDLTSLAAE